MGGAGHAAKLVDPSVPHDQGTEAGDEESGKETHKDCRAALSVPKFPSLDLKEWGQHFSSSHFWQCSGDMVNLPGLGFSQVGDWREGVAR